MDQQMDDFVVDGGDATPEKYNIVQVPADYSLEVLHSKWKSGEIIVPKFQRARVWNSNQASRLIESFVMGLPVPPVYMFVGPDKRMQVVDGQQRLMSIFSFFEERFEKGDEFWITGISRDNPLYGKSMSEMSDTDQRRIRQSILRCILIHQIGHDSDNTAAYHVFERLNTGRTPMRDQEVRNCIYEGGLNDMLMDLNRDSNWRAVLGRPEPDERKRDVEIILRYLALLHDGANYRKPMRDFLSRYMNNNREPSCEFVQKESEVFRETCRILNECGKRPLNQNGPVRVAVFDAVLVAFGKNRGSRPDDMCGRIEKLTRDEEFASHTSHATSDPAAVNGRLEIAEGILFG